ncbi:MAG: 4Fe-4S binding protein [Nitrososphaerota archaeon]|nr:4Fe-4S binding protein [Candidatus Geocrenenecus dongiae]
MNRSNEIRRLSITDSEKCVGCQLCMFACSRRFGIGGLEKSAILVRSVGGIERGLTVVVCRACLDPPCAKVCPTRALRIRKYGGVLLDKSKCIGCGNCVRACDIGAVFWDSGENKPIICIHCGYCVRYCHYNVIRLEVMK